MIYINHSREQTLLTLNFKHTLISAYLELEQITSLNSDAYLMTDDGSQTLFSTLSLYIPNFCLILWRYGLDAFRLKFWLSKKLSNFLR